jgi:EAL domain-containing protein (putative c-di-GMP-specific phosphodiesterase class I)
MQHPEQSIAVLQQIRALGVELSVDDFGTGQSSLNYLMRLPINRLKIDRSFVWDIHENREGETITSAVIAMGHGLNLQITAEGVETPAQRKFLEKHYCNEAQGYLFSRPLPAEKIDKLLNNVVLNAAAIVV